MANLLIIDDEEYIRDILSVRAEKLNHSAYQAATISQGLDLIKKEIFDLVLLDIILPDGSGLDFLKTIQKLPSRPKVIIITATASLENIETAKKNGAWDVLSKPVKKEDIILQIKRALE